VFVPEVASVAAVVAVAPLAMPLEAVAPTPPDPPELVVADVLVFDDLLQATPTTATPAAPSRLRAVRRLIWGAVMTSPAKA
jgi:hypothetical protein